MKRALIMLGLVVALAAAFAGTARAADATATATDRLQSLDTAILAKLNATRAAHGLRPLVVSDQLEAAAVAHSREMLDRGFFAHDTPGGASFVERIRSFYKPSGYSSWSAGENLVYSSAAMDANTAVRAWMESPPHRQNMLDPTWREIGIGSLHAAWAGGTFGGDPTWVVTMDFGMRRGGSAKEKPTAARVVTVHKAVTKKVLSETHPLKRPGKPTRVDGGNKPAGGMKAHGKKTHAGQKAKPKQHRQPKSTRKDQKPKKQPERVLPTPAAPSPAGPDPAESDAANRHYYGDEDDQAAGADDGAADPGTADPGTAADTPPAPAS
jgi:uncharacterized protein YkwD